MNLRILGLLLAIFSNLSVNYSYCSHTSASDVPATIEEARIQREVLIEKAILGIARSFFRVILRSDDVNEIKSRLFTRYGHTPTPHQETDIIPLTLDYLIAEEHLR